MYEGMNVCMYECMNVWMYECMYVWMYECMYECMNVWMYTLLKECMYVWMYDCMNVWMYVCMNVWMYVWIYECIHYWRNVWMYEYSIFVFHQRWLKVFPRLRCWPRACKQHWQEASTCQSTPWKKDGSSRPVMSCWQTHRRQAMSHWSGYCWNRV